MGTRTRRWATPSQLERVRVSRSPRVLRRGDRDRQTALPRVARPIASSRSPVRLALRSLGTIYHVGHLACHELGTAYSLRRPHPTASCKMGSNRAYRSRARPRDSRDGSRSQAHEQMGRLSAGSCPPLHAVLTALLICLSGCISLFRSNCHARKRRLCPVAQTSRRWRCGAIV